MNTTTHPDLTDEAKPTHDETQETERTAQTTTSSRTRTIPHSPTAVAQAPHPNDDAQSPGMHSQMYRSSQRTADCESGDAHHASLVNSRSERRRSEPADLAPRPGPGRPGPNMQIPSRQGFLHAEGCRLWANSADDLRLREGSRSHIFPRVSQTLFINHLERDTTAIPATGTGERNHIYTITHGGPNTCEARLGGTRDLPADAASTLASPLPDISHGLDPDIVAFNLPATVSHAATLWRPRSDVRASRTGITDVPVEILRAVASLLVDDRHCTETTASTPDPYGHVSQNLVHFCPDNHVHFRQLLCRDEEWLQVDERTSLSIALRNPSLRIATEERPRSSTDSAPRLDFDDAILHEPHSTELQRALSRICEPLGCLHMALAITATRARRCHEKHSPANGRAAYWRLASHHEEHVRRQCRARLWLRKIASDGHACIIVSDGHAHIEPDEISSVRETANDEEEANELINDYLADNPWSVVMAPPIRVGTWYYTRFNERLHSRLAALDATRARASFTHEHRRRLSRRRGTLCCSTAVVPGEHRLLVTSHDPSQLTPLSVYTASRRPSISSLPSVAIGIIIRCLHQRVDQRRQPLLIPSPSGISWAQINEVNAALAALGHMIDIDTAVAIKNTMQLRVTSYTRHEKENQALADSYWWTGYPLGIAQHKAIGAAMLLRRTHERLSPLTNRGNYWRRARRRESAETERTLTAAWLRDIAMSCNAPLLVASYWHQEARNRILAARGVLAHELTFRGRTEEYEHWGTPRIKYLSLELPFSGLEPEENYASPPPSPTPPFPLPSELCVLVIEYLHIRCDHWGTPLRIPSTEGTMWRQIDEVYSARIAFYGALDSAALADIATTRRRRILYNNLREYEWPVLTEACRLARNDTREHARYKAIRAGMLLRRTHERLSPSADRANYWRRATRREAAEAQRSYTATWLFDLAKASNAPSCSLLARVQSARSRILASRGVAASELTLTECISDHLTDGPRRPNSLALGLPYPGLGPDARHDDR